MEWCGATSVNACANVVTTECLISRVLFIQPILLDKQIARHVHEEVFRRVGRKNNKDSLSDGIYLRWYAFPNSIILTLYLEIK